MCGGGNPFSAAVNIVTAPVRAVGGAAASVISNVPVVGTGLSSAIRGGVAIISSAPNTLSDIASGQNVGQALGNDVSGVLAGGEQISLSPSLSVANTVTPTSVQELPLISNIETYNDAGEDITDNTLANSNNSKGTLENFYRNGAEIGAVVAGGAAATGAFSGAGTASEAALDTSAINVTSEATLADVGVDAGAATGSGVLGTAATIAGSTGVLGLGEKLLGSKLPPGVDSVLGLPTPGAPGTPGSAGTGQTTIVKPGPNGSGGGGGAGGGMGGLSTAASLGIVGIGLVAALAWKARK